MFRVLLLDLDDTLFDRGAAVGRWARERLGKLDEDSLAWLYAVDDRGRRPRAELTDAIKARFGVTVNPDRFPLELAPHIEPEPGVRELLGRLGQTRRIAIVSNGNGAGQRAKLRATGLDRVVHAVFISGELGIAKPAAKIFERALRWAEHEPRDCLFVGDDPINDLVPAAALGMATAWRVREDWPVELAPPEFTLQSLAELEAIA